MTGGWCRPPTGSRHLADFRSAGHRAETRRAKSPAITAPAAIAGRVAAGSVHLLLGRARTTDPRGCAPPSTAHTAPRPVP